jgi:hypothetical protein
MHDYLEKKEYLKRVKKQGKWQSVGGQAPVSIGRVGLLPDVTEGQVPEEVTVQAYTERRQQNNYKGGGEYTPKHNKVM